MTQHKGYYSLIQFCPDASRLEGINIGVLLYSAVTGKLHFRLAEGNQRIRKFFGQQDWHFVDRARESLESRLQMDTFASVGDLESFIAKRANVIQLTHLRSIKVQDLEQDLLALFRRLVEPEKAAPKPRIVTALSRRIIEAGVEGLMEKSIRIEIANFKQPIHVPYGYKNGRFNLVTPIQFNADREDILSKAGKSAIEGQLLYQHPDPHFGPLQLVVVAKFADQSGLLESSSSELVRKIFDDHKVSLHTFENMGPFFEDIRKSAQLHARSAK